MRPPLTNFSAIRHALASNQPDERGAAMQALLNAVRQNSKLHDEARPIFLAAILIEPDAWTATSAARGLQVIDGVTAAEGAWRSLLTRPDAIFASRIARAVDQPAYAGLLMELLNSRTEMPFRSSAIRSLGRLRDPAAMPLLLQLGQTPDLQPDVVQALGDLGDPTAIPWIKPFIADDRVLPESDDRGGVVMLGDIAAQIVRTLEHLGGARPTEPYADAPAVPARRWKPVIPVFGDPPIVRWRKRIAGFIRHRLLRSPAWVPLIAAAFEVAWLGLLFLAYLFISGDARPPELPTELVDAVAMLPAAFGLGYGLIAIARGRAPTRRQKVVAVIGMLLCAAFVVMFGRELVSG